MPRTSLNEILENGSDAFRKLNGGIAREVPADPRAKAKTVGALAAAIPDAKPEPRKRKTLGGIPTAPDGSGASLGERPTVCFTLYRVRLLDPDNKWASVKHILDAMRKAELIPNDRERDILLSVDQIAVRHFADEGTTIGVIWPNT